MERAGDGLTEEKYRRLVEVSPGAVCVHILGRVVYVNPAALRLTGATHIDQVVGRPFTDFLTTESIPALVARVAELNEAGDHTSVSRADLVQLDGTVVTVESISVATVWDGEPARQVIFRDVTAQKPAEEALKVQAALVNYVSDAIIATTPAGVVTSWNPAAEAIYGRTAEAAMGASIADLVGAELDPVAIVGSGGIVHATHRSAAGEPLTVRVSVAAMEDGYAFVCCDLTALHRAEAHFESVVSTMSEGIIVTDCEGFIKSINPAAVKMTGARAEHVGSNFFDITSQYPFYDAEGVDIAPDLRPALAVLRTGVPFFNQVFGVPRRHGKRGWLMSSCRLLNPDMVGNSDMLISFTDITAQRERVADVEFMATHDELTRLPNRATVLRRIDKALATSHVYGHRLRALLFIDIDGLKQTNDTLGHRAGDELLRAAAQRLVRAAGEDGMVGRLGGDEFVFLIFGDATRQEIDDTVLRVRRELMRPETDDATKSPVRASIGVVEVGHDDERTADDILSDADLAMYEVKRERRG